MSVPELSRARPPPRRPGCAVGGVAAARGAAGRCRRDPPERCGRASRYEYRKGAQCMPWQQGAVREVDMATVGIREAARLLGVSTDTIRRRIERRDLPAHKDASGRWLIDLDDSLVVPAAPPATELISSDREE